MMTNDVNLLWIVFWVVVGVGVSLLSFNLLKKNVESIQPPQTDEKPKVGKLVIQRFGFLLVIAVLIYLALRTEPIAAVAMVISLTVATWVQVLVLNSKLKKEEERLKDIDFGRN